MKSIIVQISGKQGSGKSSLAQSLKMILMNNGCVVIDQSYAKILYLMHDKVMELLDKIAPKEIKPLPKKDGKLLQLLGTEWGRKQYGSDIWVNIVRETMQHDENWVGDDKTVIHIISDCRFPNELQAFPEALCYRLECPENVRKERILATPGQCWREGVHESEIALDNSLGFDHTFRTDLLSVAEITNTVVEQILTRSKL